jgi:tyrosyl-tRNA synthetase
MSSFRSPLLQVLQERGFIHQTTPIEALDSVLVSGPVPIYYGCDATASSLHVGNLMGLMVMRWVQTMGHQVIMLVGGGTTKVGDPSGRDTSRSLLSTDQIAENIKGIVACYERILDKNTMVVVDNAHWLDSLGYTAFLRDIGVHFSVNRMLNFDSVKTRLDREEPLSFIEFNYILLQSYDFLQLYRNKGCLVQVGGSDQWGNMVSGVDLVRRIEGASVHALTWPLLETSSGVKMGKTANGAIWLDPARYSPYDYWQFWRNVDDRDVVRFLKLFTMLPMDQIEPFVKTEGQALNAAKILLADQACALVHGQEVLAGIHGGQLGAGAADSGSHLCPTYTWSAEDREQGVLVYKILLALGWVASGREGRQKITEGAIKIDDVKIDDPMAKLFFDPVTTARSLKIGCGAKKTGLILVHDPV